MADIESAPLSSEQESEIRKRRPVRMLRLLLTALYKMERVVQETHDEPGAPILFKSDYYPLGKPSDFSLYSKKPEDIEAWRRWNNRTSDVVVDSRTYLSVDGEGSVKLETHETTTELRHRYDDVPPDESEQKNEENEASAFSDFLQEMTPSTSPFEDFLEMNQSKVLWRLSDELTLSPHGEAETRRWERKYSDPEDFFDENEVFGPEKLSEDLPGDTFSDSETTFPTNPNKILLLMTNFFSELREKLHQDSFSNEQGSGLTVATRTEILDLLLEEFHIRNKEGLPEYKQRKPHARIEIVYKNINGTYTPYVSFLLHKTWQDKSGKIYIQKVEIQQPLQECFFASSVFTPDMIFSANENVDLSQAYDHLQSNINNWETTAIRSWGGNDAFTQLLQTQIESLVAQLQGNNTLLGKVYTISVNPKEKSFETKSQRRVLGANGIVVREEISQDDNPGADELNSLFSLLL